MDNNENEKQEKLTASTSSLSFNEIKQDGFLNSAISGAAYETIQRYGSAVKEHYTAYSGIDNETGKKFVKSLNKISKEKINPDYRFQNISGVMGITMVGAMVASSVNVKLAWTINVGEASVVVLDILDSIIPGLLSIVLVFVLMKLIKKGYKPLTLVFGILILSIVLAFLGIF